MEITDLKIFVVENPPPRLGGPYWIFLKLVTDDGIEGVGEVYGVPFHPDVVCKMIEDVVGRHAVGRDPFQIEQLWRSVYGRAYAMHPDLALSGVLSGVEMACWDIVGKAVEQPVYNLLGGKVRERLRTYTYIYPSADDDYAAKDGREERFVADSNMWDDPDWTARRAMAYVEMGFTALKFDPILPMSIHDPRQLDLEALDRSAAVTHAVREAVGSRCDILIGTHGQMTPAAAIRLARRLEPLEPLWFEEPVPPENVEAMALVARATSIPIASGERLASKHDFARLLEANSAAILQPALGRVGGLLEAKKIAGMAEAHYVQVAPHLYCGPVELAANVQLGLCSPNFLVLESIEDLGGFHAEVLETGLAWQDGHVLAPTAPGLGVELDETVCEAHRYAGEFYDEMRQNPL